MFSAGIQNNRVFIMLFSCVSVLSSYPLHHLPVSPFYPSVLFSPPRNPLSFMEYISILSV